MGQGIKKDQIISVVIYHIVGDDVGFVFKTNAGSLRLYKCNKNYNKICNHVKLNNIHHLKIVKHDDFYIIKDIII